MLTSPWNLVLTIAFVFTGVVCAVRLAGRRRAAPLRRGLSSHDVVHLDHGLMSVAMIVMTWLDVPGAAVGVQVALFAALAVALTLDLREARSLLHRVDLAGHVVLNVAMVWMLVAMPLLMAGTASGDAGHADHAGHAGHGAHDGAVAAATPAWAGAVNVGLVVVCAAWALWWLYRAAAHRGHRLHTLCHAVMAAGMGGMLALMGA